MKTQELTIQGMTCGHCVMAVKKELAKVPGLVVENVEIGKAVVRYEGDQVTTDDLERAIEAAGYSVIG